MTEPLRSEGNRYTAALPGPAGDGWPTTPSEEIRAMHRREAALLRRELTAPRLPPLGTPEQRAARDAALDAYMTCGKCFQKVCDTSDEHFFVSSGPHPDDETPAASWRDPHLAAPLGANEHGEETKETA